MSAVDLEAIRGGSPPRTVRRYASTSASRPAWAAAACRRRTWWPWPLRPHADPRLELAGLWSHLHSPEDPPTSDGQLLRFEVATTALREARIPVPPRHIAASGGIFAGDEPALDLVRPGIAIYGVLDDDLPIAADAAGGRRPAASGDVASRLAPIAFSDVPRRAAPSATAAPGGPSDRRVSRSCRWATATATCAARSPAPKCSCEAGGRPLVGRVSMDAVTVDVTDLPGLDYAEEFVLLGAPGRANRSPPGNWRVDATPSPGKCSRAWLRDWPGCTIRWPVPPTGD